MEFFKRILKNGINVIMEKRETPVVSFSISNRFGAASEEGNVKGIAHLIEHLVFTGTKTRTHEDISGEIEKKGGIINAFTVNEVTCFWFKLPSEHIFLGIDILADILNNPLFLPEKFEKEKKVVLEEIKMYHDDPARYVQCKIIENLYEYPFGTGIIGTDKTVSSLGREFVLDYFKKSYSPNNFIVTLVGNADFDKVCNYLENKFEKGSVKIMPPEIKKKNAESVEEREGIDQAHLVFAVHAPLTSDEDYPVLEILDSYLSMGMSSKLFLNIREEKGLAYTVQGAITSEKNYSYYSIYTGTNKESISEIKKIIIEEFKNVEKMTDKELEESKEKLIGFRKVSSEESSNVMNELIFSEISSKAEEYYKRNDKIKKVNLSQVKKLAKNLIKNYSIAAIVPK